MISQKSKTIYVFLVAIVLVMSFYLGFSKVFAQNTLVPSPKNVSGFAWADTIGWISFNSKDCDPDEDGFFGGIPPGCPSSGVAHDYGVIVNPFTGDMSGFAWADAIGWISFNGSDVLQCPSGSAPQINLNTGKITGWARALAGSTPESGGWTGCIKLSDTQYFPSPDPTGMGGSTYIYGVPGSIVGYAWGSEVVGWVKFHNVKLDLSNPIVDLQVSGGGQAKNYKINVPNSALPFSPTLYFSSKQVKSSPSVCTTSSTSDIAWNNYKVTPNSMGKTTGGVITQPGTYTYTVSCPAPDGKTYQGKAEVTVSSTVLPYLEISALGSVPAKGTAITLPVGSKVQPTLYWSGTNGYNCNQLSGIINSSNPIDGVWNKANITGPSGKIAVNKAMTSGVYSYTLACADSSGNPVSPFPVATMTIGGSTPSVSIDADGNYPIDKLPPGVSSAVVSWSTSDSTYCSVGAGNTGQWDTSVISTGNGKTPGSQINLLAGSFKVNNITSSQIFSIECGDALGNMDNDSVTITPGVVIPPVVCPGTSIWINGTCGNWCPDGSFVQTGTVCSGPIISKMCWDGSKPVNNVCPPRAGGVAPKFEEI